MLWRTQSLSADLGALFGKFAVTVAGFTVADVAEALLREWSKCILADRHGCDERCYGDECTFTSDLFNFVCAVITGDANA